MKPNERENKLYSDGKRIQIELEEQVMFDFLQQHSKGRDLYALDVGCVTGEISIELINKGYKIKGIDFSDVAIDICKNAGLDCYVSDVNEGIQEKDKTFDLVWAGDILEHVFDPLLLMKEVSRILKPGGLFLFSIPNDTHLMNRLRLCFGHSPQERTYQTLGQCKHHTFFSKSLITYMINNANLSKCDVRYILRIPKTNYRCAIKRNWLNLFTYSMVIAAKKTMYSRIEK